ncbi:kinase-like domain-containing protein [Gautieria morchelliformis]|nr:kinase-like domain-containing protein [Gautieria morchelliformis]
MAAPVAQHPLEQYESLEVIGNGSFGIIRKVRRKSDGVVLARKELNFERMTERDRKQIVAEVNILKDLCHENIVRYHDRYVDRDNGILYILMEYCGGGDLSSIIKNCARSNRSLPEDTVWNYFLQILHALHHCHFPTTDSPHSPSSSTPRQQILHRDLKPENVFLDANQVIKLGDFGLSKALGAASFANTYVGTPYYMSPELMQEKAYDTKSDIWSLGCLIYELCALKPPFHEAKTHNELSIFIRNGRIPPLPRGYSQALHQVIKAMLNINPAMRPSAQQLLHHERLELVSKVHETEKMLTLAKQHKQMLINRERDLLLRERELQAKVLSFQQGMADAQARHEAELEVAVTMRVSEREAQLREAVMRKEEEVRDRMEKREAELLEAVMRREEELRGLWEQYEMGLRAELRGREEEVKRTEERLKKECGRKEEVMKGCTDGDESIEFSVLLTRCRLGEPIPFPTSQPSNPLNETPARVPNHNIRRPPMPETPLTSADPPVSAMRGVVLTDTGEMIPTPAAAPHPVELARLVLDSPRVGLDFGGIFDGHTGYEEDSEDGESEHGESDDLASPSARRMRILAQKERERKATQEKENVSPVSHAPATRLRKPSIRTTRPSLLPSFPSCPAGVSGNATTRPPADPASQSVPASTYDLDDEENLPSPFLKRTELAKAHTRRGSAAHDLRAKAAANAAMSSSKKMSRIPGSGPAVARPSLERAKQASEDAKKALFKP